MFSLGLKPLFQDEIHEPSCDCVGEAEINAGHDHEPDHDPGGLHHLPAIWPLYPLKLAPASLQEADQTVDQPGAVRRHRRSGRAGRRELASATTTGPPAGPVGLVRFKFIVERLRVVVLGLGGAAVVVAGQLGPSERQLGVRELDIRRSVIQRRWELELVAVVPGGGDPRV
jgi:hypothetical protein